MRNIRRNTASKVWISNIVNNNYVKGDSEWDPSYIRIKGKNISRISVIATVTSKYENEDKTFSSLTIDDGSSQIRTKTWREDSKILKDVNVGDIVHIIGKIRSYNEENYINPEVIRRLKNPNWELLRKLELIKEFGVPKKTEIKKEEEKQVLVEEVKDSISEGDRQKIISNIEKLDSVEGVKKARLITETTLDREKAESILQELLREGEIYEVEPERFRITE